VVAEKLDAELRAYWGPREESAEDVAAKMVEFLTALGGLDPLLGVWRRNARAKSAVQPLALDVETMTALAHKGRNRSDFGKNIIEDLGFRYNLVTPEPPKIYLRCVAGVYSPVNVNVIIMRFSDLSGRAATVASPRVADGVVDALVGAWGPDWAVWESRRIDKVPENWVDYSADLGWKTYLRGVVLGDVPHGSVRSLGEGVVLTVAPELAAVAPGDIAADLVALRAAGRWPYYPTGGGGPLFGPAPERPVDQWPFTPPDAAPQA
jgi:hypothetical protein